MPPSLDDPPSLTPSSTFVPHASRSATAHALADASPTPTSSTTTIHLPSTVVLVLIASGALLLLLVALLFLICCIRRIRAGRSPKPGNISKPSHIDSWGGGYRTPKKPVSEFPFPIIPPPTVLQPGLPAPPSFAGRFSYYNAHGGVVSLKNFVVDESVRGKVVDQRMRGKVVDQRMRGKVVEQSVRGKVVEESMRGKVVWPQRTVEEKRLPMPPSAAPVISVTLPNNDSQWTVASDADDRSDVSAWTSPSLSFSAYMSPNIPSPSLSLSAYMSPNMRSPSLSLSAYMSPPLPSRPEPTLDPHPERNTMRPPVRPYVYVSPTAPPTSPHPIAQRYLSALRVSSTESVSSITSSSYSQTSPRRKLRDPESVFVRRGDAGGEDVPPRLPSIARLDPWTCIGSAMLVSSPSAGPSTAADKRAEPTPTPKPTPAPVKQPTGPGALASSSSTRGGLELLGLSTGNSTPAPLLSPISTTTSSYVGTPGSRFSPPTPPPHSVPSSPMDLSDYYGDYGDDPHLPFSNPKPTAKPRTQQQQQQRPRASRFSLSELYGSYGSPPASAQQQGVAHYIPRRGGDLTGTAGLGILNGRSHKRFSSELDARFGIGLGINFVPRRPNMAPREGYI